MKKWKEKNYVGMTGGHDGTYYEVVAQTSGTHIDNPTIIDGVEIYHLQSRIMDKCTTEEECNDSIKKYFAARQKREREAVILTVAGNPISLESALSNSGYEAFSSSPHTVDVYGYKSTVA